MLLSVFVFCGCSNDDEVTHTLILPDYETHTLDLGDRNNPAESWSTSYEDYNTGETITTNYFHTLLTDKSGIFEFDCFSTDMYGFGSDGFAFSNCTVEGCSDFAVYDYRAVPKKGVNNNTYVIVGAAGYKTGPQADKDAAIRFKGSNTAIYEVQGMYITNCVYSYRSMKEGIGFYREEEIFGANDWLKLTIYSADKSKKVECRLAEGTNIMSEWKWVDLTPLGVTDGLQFKIESSKTNEYGPLTPTYFCLDGITLVEK